MNLADYLAANPNAFAGCELKPIFDEPTAEQAATLLDYDNQLAKLCREAESQTDRKQYNELREKIATLATARALYWSKTPLAWPRAYLVTTPTLGRPYEVRGRIEYTGGASDVDKYREDYKRTHNGEEPPF